MGDRELYEGNQEAHGLAHHPDILTLQHIRLIFTTLKVFIYPSHVHLYHGVGAAHDQDEKVGDAEVEEEQVGGGPHRLGGEDDDEDEDVADDADGQDEAEEDEAGVGDVGREDPLLLRHVGGVR